MLTDIASVRALLQDEEGDKFDDALIEFLIDAASVLIGRFTRHEFESPTAGAGSGSGDDGLVTREFVAYGPSLDLVPYDLRELDSIVDVTDDTPAEITTFKLRPRPARDGVYTWIEMPGVCGTREIEVSGLWGWPRVPSDVKLWCGITVVTWIRGDIAAFSTTFAIDEGRVQRPEELPSAVKHALRDYQRGTTRLPIV